MRWILVAVALASAPDGVVATVNAVPIDARALGEAAGQIRVPADRPTLTPAEVAQALDGLIDDELLTQEAITLGMLREPEGLERTAAVWLGRQTRGMPRDRLAAAHRAYLEGLRAATPPVIERAVVDGLRLPRDPAAAAVDTTVIARVGAERLTVQDLTPFLVRMRRGEGAFLSPDEVSALVSWRVDLALLLQEARRGDVEADPELRRWLRDRRAAQVLAQSPPATPTAAELDAWAAARRYDPAPPGSARVSLVWVPGTTCGGLERQSADAIAAAWRTSGGFDGAIDLAPCPARMDDLGWIPDALTRGVPHPDGVRVTGLAAPGEASLVVDVYNGYGFYVLHEVVPDHTDPGWIKRATAAMQQDADRQALAAYAARLRTTAAVSVDHEELRGLVLQGAPATTAP